MRAPAPLFVELALTQTYARHLLRAAALLLILPACPLVPALSYQDAHVWFPFLRVSPPPSTLTLTRGGDTREHVRAVSFTLNSYQPARASRLYRRNPLAIVIVAPHLQSLHLLSQRLLLVCLCFLPLRLQPPIPHARTQTRRGFYSRRSLSPRRSLGPRGSQGDSPT